MSTSSATASECRGRLVLWFAAVLAATCSVALAPQPSGARADNGATTDAKRWEPLPGPYARDPRLPTLLREVERFRKRALDELRQRWKLELGSTPVFWRIATDSAPASRLGGKRQRRASTFELGRTFFDSDGVVVVLPARKFLARPERIEQVVVHECVHAIYASRLGSAERYEMLPYWFREGLALLISGEGPIRLRERVAYSVFEGGTPDAFLAVPPGGRPTRAEAFATLDALRGAMGDEVFQALISQVARGSSLDRACEEIVGIKLEALRLRAVAQVRRRALELAPQNVVERFRAAYRRLITRLPGAQEELEAFLADSQKSALAGTARYLLAREGVRAAGSEKAALNRAKIHLRTLLGSSEDLWRPEAMVLHGRVDQIEKRNEHARAMWLSAIEQFGEDHIVAERARRFIAQLAESPATN